MRKCRSRKRWLTDLSDRVKLNFPLIWPFTWAKPVIERMGIRPVRGPQCSVAAGSSLLAAGTHSGCHSYQLSAISDSLISRRRGPGMIDFQELQIVQAAVGS